MAKLKGWWTNGFSMDETKTSLTMLLFVPVIVVTLIMYWKYQTVESGMVTVILGFLGSITGINIAEKITGKKSSSVVDEIVDKMDEVDF